MGLTGDLAFANLLLRSRSLIRLPLDGGWADGVGQLGCSGSSPVFLV